jgi:hypothetical protein
MVRGGRREPSPRSTLDHSASIDTPAPRLASTPHHRAPGRDSGHRWHPRMPRPGSDLSPRSASDSEVGLFRSGRALRASRRHSRPSSMRLTGWATWLLVASITSACGSSSSGGSEAMRRGVGSACATNADCTEPGQTCLQFKGGYCGIEGCAGDAGACPSGSACVQHTDGKSYCFFICVDKAE